MQLRQDSESRQALIKSTEQISDSKTPKMLHSENVVLPKPLPIKQVLSAQFSGETIEQERPSLPQRWDDSRKHSQGKSLLNWPTPLDSMSNRGG